MHSIRSTLHRAIVLGLIASTASCTEVVTAGSGGDVRRTIGPNLEQHVTVSPSEPRVGENVTIHSVITNRGTEAVALSSRICGLDLSGDLQVTFAPGIGFCAGHSIGGSIPTGASRESTDIRRVASSPGTHSLRVRHALQPELWVELRVVVRP
jgi:hypothetical protein